MQKGMRKHFSLRRLLVILGLTAIILCTNSNGEAADAQTKSPYLVKINRVYNTITIYEQDEKGKYTVPIKAMLCSVGTNNRTITGTFNTKGKYRWKALMGDVWGQYSTRIVGGILFHSVYYYGKGNPASLATNEFNKLGTAASHGCVRLSVKDAKWIYDNCSIGTTVVIYDDKKNPGPLGKPEAIRIASTVRWDPTDPDKNNPYLEKQPTITGTKNFKIDWGENYDLLKGVKATSSVGTNITPKVNVEGELDTTIPGKYLITYSVTDALDKKTTKEITVTVLNNKIAPTFVGVSDKVVSPEEIIDADFALSGVKAYVKNIKLDLDLINLSIVEINDLEYEITYSISAGNGPITTKIVKIHIDNEAPVFTGIADGVVDTGIIPDEAYAMMGVTVSDNYTSLEKIIVAITMIDNQDGTFLVTYEATDEVGNITTEQATIRQLTN